jgi:transcriptional regulator with GAF, ATPase, and Fis domain
VASGPLVPVNCGAIPNELIASELFGRKKGAFTGAVADRRGAFESADGGTLFLDEVGELPIEMQPMLLRTLETGQIRVGRDQTKSVKIRPICATNRNLEEEVAAGRFREDLYYRLAVVRIHAPPLRERLDDIEELARFFAARIGIDALSEAVLEALRARPWPATCANCVTRSMRSQRWGRSPAFRKARFVERLSSLHCTGRSRSTDRMQPRRTTSRTDLHASTSSG